MLDLSALASYIIIVLLFRLCLIIVPGCIDSVVNRRVVQCCFQFIFKVDVINCSSLSFISGWLLFVIAFSGAVFVLTIPINCLWVIRVLYYSCTLSTALTNDTVSPEMFVGSGRFILPKMSQ